MFCSDCQSMSILRRNTFEHGIFTGRANSQYDLRSIHDVAGWKTKVLEECLKWVPKEPKQKDSFVISMPR